MRPGNLNGVNSMKPRNLGQVSSGKKEGAKKAPEKDMLEKLRNIKPIVKDILTRPSSLPEEFYNYDIPKKQPKAKATLDTTPRYRSVNRFEHTLPLYQTIMQNQMMHYTPPIAIATTSKEEAAPAKDLLQKMATQEATGLVYKSYTEEAPEPKTKSEDLRTGLQPPTSAKKDDNWEASASKSLLELLAEPKPTTPTLPEIKVTASVNDPAKDLLKIMSQPTPTLAPSTLPEIKIKTSVNDTTDLLSKMSYSQPVVTTTSTSSIPKTKIDIAPAKDLLQVMAAPAPAAPLPEIKIKSSVNDTSDLLQKVSYNPPATLISPNAVPKSAPAPLPEIKIQSSVNYVNPVLNQPSPVSNAIPLNISVPRAPALMQQAQQMQTSAPSVPTAAIQTGGMIQLPPPKLVIAPGGGERATPTLMGYGQVAEIFKKSKLLTAGTIALIVISSYWLVSRHQTGRKKTSPIESFLDFITKIK